MMGGGRVNTIEVPNIDASQAILRFQQASAKQEAGIRTGLQFYETALQEASVAMRAGYDKSNKTLATLSQSSNTALDETMRMLNLDPIRREGEEYKGKYSQEEVSDKLSQTPGYQFQVDQGTKAIERQGAAKGMLGSGNTLLALQDYGQKQAMGYFQGYLQNLNQVTESGKAATMSIANNEVGMGQFDSQKEQMIGTARRETEVASGQIAADEQYRSAAAKTQARLENMNNAYRYFATASNKAAQDYSTNSANNRAADQLGFTRDQFQYKQQQGVDAYNQLGRSTQQNTGLRYTNQGWLT